MKLDLECGGRMNKEIHVLEVNINDIGQGGAWAFIKNAINAKSDKDIIFDFFTLEPFENESNIEFIEENKGTIFVRYTVNRYIRQIKTYFDLKKVVKENKFDIVHIHSDLAFKMFIEGLAAKRAGAKNIIFHSHCTGVDGDHRKIKEIAHKICRLFLGEIGTVFFACSKLAGKWMYVNSLQDKVVVINNAVDCQKFKFSKNIRDEYRKKLMLNEDEILIGHVGRFMYQKNHQFIIKIFKQYNKINSNSKLLLVGEGEFEDEIKNIVNNINLESKVIFLGVTDCVNNYMQAMDLFLLPSLFEGLPVVGIEAQAAGLPCLLSDSITKETNLFGLVEFMSLNENEKKWAEKIQKMLSDYVRKDTYNDMVNCGYDISQNKESLKNIYYKTCMESSL